MNIELPEIPQNHIDFAIAIKVAADKFGIKSLRVTYTPEFKNRVKQESMSNCDMKIHYSNLDGRGRPANNLRLELDTTLTKVLTETPESSS